MAEHLLEGVERFRERRFPALAERFRELVDNGQHPSTLFITCSDSRIDPALLTDTGPGELFVARNPGNFVPRHDPDAGLHATAASIEFAVAVLNVGHIVVCGHSGCGAIRALFSEPDPATPHLARWVELGLEAAEEDAEPSPEVLRRTERRSVVVQLRRLLTYPMVRERVDAGRLVLHGWHYVLEDGRVDVLKGVAA